MCNRACSALTQSMSVIERKKVTVHAALQTKVSGQLPFLGLLRTGSPNIPTSSFTTKYSEIFVRKDEVIDGL